MRLVLCWADISGYMAACWRALAATEGIELSVIAFEAGQKTFNNELVKGIDCRILNAQEKGDAALICSLVKERRPDILYVSGWFHPPYRSLLHDGEFELVPKWIGVDTPWWGTFRQHAATIALRRLMRRVDRAFVAGERAWQYMRRLGLAESQISRGLYGVDYDALSQLREQREQQEGGWPRRFLYAGRYAPEKGLDVLMDGYARYRASVRDPWPLICCGTGSGKGLLADRAGVEDLGFQQPGDMMSVMAQHGVFVLASRFDPWPLVVVEACAAGLPVICTEACGSAVELVRPYFNGIGVATGDAEALARALRWAHDHHTDLPEMGRRASEMAAAYSAGMWAARWSEAARDDLRRGN
jgi:glycosyltransferase involved in cell wall biosynthesis